MIKNQKENYLTSPMSLYVSIGKLSLSKSSWSQTSMTFTLTHPSDCLQFFTSWAPRNIVSLTLEMIRKSNSARGKCHQLFIYYKLSLFIPYLDDFLKNMWRT